MVERKVLQNAIRIGLMNDGGLPKTTAALGVFAAEQVAFARVPTQNFSGSGDLKPLRDGFFCLDTFWTSHNFKMSAEYRERATAVQDVFSLFCFNLT